MPFWCCSVIHQIPCGAPPHQLCSRFWGCPIQRNPRACCAGVSASPTRGDPLWVSEGPPTVPAPGALQRPCQSPQLWGWTGSPPLRLSLQEQVPSPGPVPAGGWPLHTRLCPARPTPSFPAPGRKIHPGSPNLTLAKSGPSLVLFGASFPAVLKHQCLCKHIRATFVWFRKK